jgi:hypothetical protein
MRARVIFLSFAVTNATGEKKQKEIFSTDERKLKLNKFQMFHCHPER